MLDRVARNTKKYDDELLAGRSVVLPGESKPTKLPEHIVALYRKAGFTKKPVYLATVGRRWGEAWFDNLYEDYQGKEMEVIYNFNEAGEYDPLGEYPSTGLSRSAWVTGFRDSGALPHLPPGDHVPESESTFDEWRDLAEYGLEPPLDRLVPWRLGAEPSDVPVPVVKSAEDRDGIERSLKKIAELEDIGVIWRASRDPQLPHNFTFAVKQAWCYIKRVFQKLRVICDARHINAGCRSPSRITLPRGRDVVEMVEAAAMGSGRMISSQKAWAVQQVKKEVEARGKASWGSFVEGLPGLAGARGARYREEDGGRYG